MSFLKQLLNPFIEFDEDTKNKKPVANAPVQPSPSIVPPAKQAPQPTVQSPSADEPAEHPLISGNAAVPAADQIPTYSPGGTIAGPLPEHHQYFEKLIEEANNKNPLFQGTDFKEFVDSKVLIRAAFP